MGSEKAESNQITHRTDPSHITTSAADESSENELAAMYESSDDQHSVGLVQASLATVYKTKVHSTEPRLFQEAMYHPDADLWFKAALEEIDAHHSNGIWESV
jgi:hypothetical protein